MNNSNNKKSGKISVYLIILILCFAVVGIIYKAAQNVKVENEPKAPEIHPVELEVTGEKLDIEDDLVRDLYSTIEVYNFGVEEVNFHRSNKITIDDLSNNFKLLVIFNQCFMKGFNTHITESQGWGDISEKDAKKVETEIFGKDANVKYESLLGYSLEFNYKNKKFESEINQKTGGMNPNVNDYMEIVAASKDEDNIYIYDKFVRVTGLSVEPEEPKVGVYATSDKEIIIDENLTQEELNDIVSKYDQLDSGGETPENYELLGLKDKYESQILTYKHTFKKSEDGTYYWVSSEPIK